MGGQISAIVACHPCGDGVAHHLDVVGPGGKLRVHKEVMCPRRNALSVHGKIVMLRKMPQKDAQVQGTRRCDPGVGGVQGPYLEA